MKIIKIFMDQEILWMVKVIIYQVDLRFIYREFVWLLNNKYFIQKFVEEFMGMKKFWCKCLIVVVGI